MSAVELTRDERAVRQTSGPVLGMVVFVASEAMFFATFFGAYFTIYSVNPVWPPAGFPHVECFGGFGRERLSRETRLIVLAR